MFTFDFIHKLRKCNKDFWIDCNHVVYPSYDKDFPIQGLYCKEKYIMAVPNGHVSELSIAAVNFNKLIDANKFNRVQEILDTGYAFEEEKILCRGWRAIVGGLIRMGLIERSKAEKVFNTYFEPNKLELPRHYIHKNI